MRGIRIRAWLWLAATVALEVVATLALKAADGFTVPAWSIVAIAAYAGTVVALSLALREIPMGIAYVLWTGVGATSIVVLGAIIFAERIALSSWLGVALVVIGVVLIHARRAPGPQEEAHAQQGHPQ